MVFLIGFGLRQLKGGGSMIDRYSAAYERYRNRAHRGAFLKGVRAAEDGFRQSDNPYDDLRQPGGGVTYSRGYMAAWSLGFRLFGAGKIE